MVGHSNAPPAVQNASSRSARKHLPAAGVALSPCITSGASQRCGQGKGRHSQLAVTSCCD